MRKTIEAIKILHIVDDSPDTSTLGNYSDTRESTYSIDRRHTSDCPSVSVEPQEASERIDRVIDYLNTQRTLAWDSTPLAEITASSRYCAVDEALDTVVDLQDSITECNCGAGEVARNEYRYFNGPIENYKGCSPEEMRKYIAQDYARAEARNNGGWHYIGIRAEATIKIGDTLQTISSGGLWGIESDSDDAYLNSVEFDEIANLRAQLTALGFTPRAIDKAVNLSEVVK